ncbi:hypothetical protein BSBH6_00903 [Bacillus subtilis]|nr:hypothetical protein BSBH6_00903 [Bacillus subtilis]RPK27264.1 hypothetical protein BH5_00900 [Bacillus subtilis]
MYALHILSSSSKRHLHDMCSKPVLKRNENGYEKKGFQHSTENT